MNKLFLTSVFMLISCSLFSQTVKNPFEKTGYKVLMATSSKGEFEEFHDQEDIVEIGSVLYNTRTKEIVKILDKDSTTIDVSAATVAMSIDPFCERYYWISPYAYVANNPIKFIDPDGRKIVLYNYTHSGKGGGLVGSAGLSKTTEAAMSAYVGTAEGLKALSLYASEGDIVGGHTFTSNGELSGHTLEVRDISLSKEQGQILPPGKNGSITLDGKKDGTSTIRIYSLGKNEADVAETVTHELNLHGNKHTSKIKGETTKTESEDHKALKNQDTSHKGYESYNKVKKELENKGVQYKKVFKDKDKEYKEKY